MLAKAPKDGDDGLPVVRFPIFGQPKLDGVRALVKDGRVLSRSLKPIPNAEVNAALGGLEGLDGELVVGDPTAEDVFRTTSSFVRSESKTGEPWSFHVFDCWDRPGIWIDSHHRLLSAARDCPNIVVVPHRVLWSHDDLAAYEAELLGEGWEGVILRDQSAPYKFGRSTPKGPLLKVKRFMDFEAKVVGTYEEMHNANAAKTNPLGRTERSSAKDGLVGKDTLGGLIVVALNGPYEGVEFRVGTGFDAADRADLWHLWHHGQTFRGAVAKIKAFPIGYADRPRFPVFLGWRESFDLS
jgi:DNA ligase-1